ncbi:MAG: Flp pilus assembly protein CpaB [Gemmatimonadetes bacterium]|nr:Flp pilus assembly protein CpaB [Gemmatimonadota bacterium]NIT68371.1 Flp pilus assembly protein CpaB [Gemmatimonadota bacterium]NIY36948.1 Flp pilus assembly protein CpaB [Gemmatimonadota bacterium]
MLILAAVIITVGTGMVARSWINSQRAQVAAPASPPPVKKTYVLVADKNMPTGTFIQENLVTWQSWPDEKLHPGYMVKGEADPAELAGTVLRRAITAGEPITAGRIIQPGARGFLAAVLRPGYRAVSLRVNATSGIAGLVSPGDRVDIILTHAVRARRVSETVLTNVRVLAIDQKTNDQEKAPKVGKNATFEVTPKQAEMLAVLSELGRLSLSLRSLAKDEAELRHLVNSDEPLAEPDPTQGSTHTWDSEVSHLLRRRAPANQSKVQVVRGGRTVELRFNSGGKLVGATELESGPEPVHGGTSGQDEPEETAKAQSEGQDKELPTEEKEQ